MKKITGLLFCVFLLTASSVLAETPSIAAGNLEFGIGKLFSYSKVWTEDNDWDVFGIGTMGLGHRPMGEMALWPTPVFSCAYFIINGLALGLEGGYTYSKRDDKDDAEQMWFIGPEIKFYIAATESILVDAHGSFGYTGRDSGTSDYSQMNVKIGAGLNYLFTKNFAACINLDYAYYFEHEVNGSTSEDSDFNDFCFSVGLKAFVTFNE